MITIIRIACTAAAIRIGALVLVTLSVAVSTATAETLLMPKRDVLAGQPVVIWGVTTRTSGQVSITFGDSQVATFSGNIGTAGNATNNVSDRSYMNFVRVYNTPGIKTVTLSVDGEAPVTTEIQVFAPAGPTGTDAQRVTERNVRINSAIQDGLRYLWFSSANRTSFNTNHFTSWGRASFTALVVLAFENQGYRLPNDNTVPTGLYEKYVVRRGLNTLASTLSTIDIGLQPAGNPCAGAAPLAEFNDNFPPATPPQSRFCKGYVSTGPGGEGIGHAGYATALMILPFSGSGALNRVNNEGGGAGAGKTFGEITQRLINAMAWGQNEAFVGSIFNSAGRGGWNYGFNQDRMDGSTAGWNALAILDARAAGITLPSFLISEFSIGLGNSFNADGSFDYNADAIANPAANQTQNNPTHRNLARAGIGAQAHFLMGGTRSDPRGVEIGNFINSRWAGLVTAGDYRDTCDGNVNTNTGVSQNKNCAYTMFNNYKGLKLLGITQLPAVQRAAGPGNIPANDWYADYQDWLVMNQATPTTATGGNWNLRFSCCTSSVHASTAIGELILSSVALVLPDAERFASVGLAPSTASGVESSPGALRQHTVTAIAEGPVPGPGIPRPPVPGATVNFLILSGPNAGLNFSGDTGADGKVSWTYTDSLADFPLSSFGTDTIRASIGTLKSNDAVMNWLPLDQDGDSVPDTDDNCPFTANTNQTDTDGDSEGDACDADDDGDGDLDGADNCPLVMNSDQANNDLDPFGDACDADDDNDTIDDAGDNCQFAANTDQANNDLDPFGDACDADDDNDTVDDAGDNCQFTANTDQANNDGDAHGDACDTDDDDDTVGDGADNCPFTANSDQTDLDLDGEGDACDADDDGDGVADGEDNCPLTASPDQTDTDRDGIGDACDADDDGDGVEDGTDNCQFAANADQANNDADAHGDACDADDDNDTVADGADNCQFAANTDQSNNDGDTQGNACDADDDNDGVVDGTDNCQFVVNPGQTNNDGDGAGDICDPDDDNDTVLDGPDNCQFVPNTGQVNTDGDAQGDACDADDDGDAVADGGDNCQLVANSDQTDTDHDGTGDACDATPGLLTGRMNGGGTVLTADGRRVTHGFALYCDPGDDPQRLQVIWGGNQFHLESVSYSWCGEGGDADPPTANFDNHNGSGTGIYNGRPGATVTWSFGDAAGSETEDTATITISANGVVVLQVSGNVKNGNHQAHR